MYSSCDTLAGGFPHSEISGSKLICQLPEAYRRLSRPSSPVIAKASTTCTSSLDPITLTPADDGVVKDSMSICVRRSFERLLTQSKIFRLYGLLKNDSRCSRSLSPSVHADAWRQRSNQRVVEDDGIEPTTPCLQSRCSPS